MNISGITPSKHYFSLMVLLSIKKHFPQENYKCVDKYRWIVFYNGDYYGLLICFKDMTIKIFYKGECIQYFTSLKSFDDWVNSGCTKQTIFMGK